MEDLIIAISILFPIIVSLIMLFLKKPISRGVFVSLASILMIGFSLFIAYKTPFASAATHVGNISISSIITMCDFILLGFLLLMSIKYKRILPIILILVQAIPLMYFEFITKPHVDESSGYIAFFNDNLSLVMMLLIMIIGSLIAVFAVKYMDEYEHHMHVDKTRQPLFFFIVFLFLGAMSGIVLSNNLLNVYFFWEMTTLCSFLLISFSKTDEAINNAFRALWMNLIGGIAFIAGIILFYNNVGTIEISRILELKGTPNAVLLTIPLACLAIAGFTKAAQFPFQSWLLGAMVAPTPVSALLHSSTMVKAGVYLLVRFSPLFMNTNLGYAVALIGGFTFLAGSALAIGQSNAKRVLAYSTIANLGLIVATAGIGTTFAITAAVMLIIFHAVSKALLFLCVGTIEHGIGSRNIEDMDGLISKMPLIGILTSIGMFSMLLPPFGVIITKLLGIEAASKFPLVLLFIVAGSAFTVVFWTKWMGKLLTISNVQEEKLEHYSLYTVIPLSLITILVMLVSVGIIQINSNLISPYILKNWGTTANINLGSMMLIPIFITILCLASLIPVMIIKNKKTTLRKPYLCGENTQDGNEFITNADVNQKIIVGNYYLEQYFSEEKIGTLSNVLAIAFILFMFGVSI